MKKSILLCLCLCVAALLCFAAIPSAFAFGGPGLKGYAGSEKCQECHAKIYSQWALTPHARMLIDAKKNPGAIKAIDFSQVSFKKRDVYWTVGSHFVQKYITYIDNDYYVLPRIWNLATEEWERYSNAFWRAQPYTILCDGCHTTGFDPATKTFAEPSIGCESCHGPGEKHAANGDTKLIVNPENLTKERRDMICEQCHTDGKDTKAGGIYPFPALYVPGQDIDDYYTTFFAPKPKSNRWYWGSMDYKERHRMFMFWQSKFYSTARACEVCGFDRGTGQTVAERYLSRDEACGTCHQKIVKSKTHSRHTPGTVDCVDCHPPTVTGKGDRYSIHDHKFDFSGPVLPCTECHEADDKRLKKEPKHRWNFDRVKINKNISLEDACRQCHEEKKDIAETIQLWKGGGGH